MPLHTKIALSVRYRGGFFGGGGIVPFLLDPKDLLSEDDGQDGKQGKFIIFVDCTILSSSGSVPQDRYED